MKQSALNFEPVKQFALFELGFRTFFFTGKCIFYHSHITMDGKFCFWLGIAI